MLQNFVIPAYLLGCARKTAQTVSKTNRSRVSLIGSREILSAVVIEIADSQKLRTIWNTDIRRRGETAQTVA